MLATALLEWLRAWRERLAPIRPAPAAARPSKSKRRKAAAAAAQRWGQDSDSDDDFIDPRAVQVTAMGGANTSGLPSVVVLTGLSGSGKAAAIAACTQELGFAVLELNTSDVRSGRNLTRILQDATTSHQVGGAMGAATEEAEPAAKTAKAAVPDDAVPSTTQTAAALFGGRLARRRPKPEVSTKRVCAWATWTTAN